MSRRTGPGVKLGWMPDPAMVAERVARMQAGQRRQRTERAAAQRALVEGLSGMTLETLAKAVSTRHWTVAVMHLGGYDVTEIARALGYVSADVVTRLLKHPVIVRLVELVRAAQLERVMRGEYGVAAQAKAAAPAVMGHVSELAGAAAPDAAGQRKGRARRDADALRAAELVLTVSGDKVERKANMHFHVLQELSEAELEVLAERGEWPERYRGVAGLLPGGTPEKG